MNTKASLDPSELPGGSEYFEGDRLAFFDRACEGFLEAGRRLGIVEKHYRLADSELRLRFAGAALANNLAPALRHLELPASAEPAFTICAWDSRSSGTPLPLVVSAVRELLRAAPLEHMSSRGEMKALNSPRFRAAYRLGPEILSVMDSARSTGVYWIEDGVDVPYYEKGSPFTQLFGFWLERRASAVLHAAAVGDARGCVLLAGKGGSGKSTSALSCLSSGIGLVADDYCALRSGPAPCVYPLYCTAKLLPGDAPHFPHLTPASEPAACPPHAKVLFYLDPKQIPEAGPLCAVVLPAVTQGSQVTLVPCSSAEALRQLAPSTIFQLPLEPGGALRRMAELVNALPCFRLEIGEQSDRAAIPQALRALMKTFTR